MKSLAKLKMSAWMRLHNYSYWDVSSEYESFMQGQWMPEEAIRKIQWEKLQRLLVHAYNEVLYYRTLFENLSIIPTDIRTPNDLEKIPILTKKIVQEQGDRLMARNYLDSRLIPAASGGSTGQPTRLYKDPVRQAVETASTWGYHQWMGWEPGDRYIRMWGSLDQDNLKRRVYRHLKQFCQNELWVNIHRMDETAMEELAGHIRRFRPKILIGYTNVIYVLANFVAKTGLHFSELSGVVTTAETLFPHQRELIEKAFNCRVFNRYASQEIGQLAGECSHGSLHLNAMNIYFEFTGDDWQTSDTIPNSVIITDLNNYAMPFIRYQLGDIAIPASRLCSCGRGLPIISDINGRLSDVIITPDKRYIFADDIAEIFYPIKEIRQFQIIQEDMENLTVKLVKREEIGPLLKAQIQKQLQEAVGDVMNIKLNMVQNIPLLPSGKHRICISHISQKA